MADATLQPPTVTGGRIARRNAVVACAALLATFGALSLSAVRTKNATVDEPVHLASGLVELRLGDYRIDPRTPPLAKCWAALGDAALPVRFVRRGPVWRDLSWDPIGETEWAGRTLFDLAGNDGVALLDRARATMLLSALALGAVAAGWAGRLGGPVAAVVTAALFSFDPNLIAHAPLTTSDVPVSLALLALAGQAWQFGRRATVGRCLALGVWCGVAMNVKFSGLIAGPILAGLLLARACGRTPWQLPGGRAARTRPARLAVAAASLVVAAATCLALTWSCYGFRYRPAPSAAVRVDLPTITAEARRTSATAGDTGPARLDRFVHWADDNRLLPQAMLAGLLAQSNSVARWPAFLDGERFDDGRVAYYPLAVLYKTPLPTLALAALAASLVPWRRRWQRSGTTTAGSPPFEARWAVTSVALPAVIFAATALRTRVDIGIRNVLPLLPFLHVAVGCAAAWAWRSRPTLTRRVVGPLLACLAVSTVLTWPDYIPSFNALAGGTAGGIAHLADSNLDWGQDIKGLAAWHRAHPGVTIYAHLFSPGEPAWYGLDCQALWLPDADMQPHLAYPRPGPAVFAVSATHLQGLYVHPAQLPFLRRLLRRHPLAVIGGTIYLYDDDHGDRT